jgi:hypothetical protein
MRLFRNLKTKPKNDKNICKPMNRISSSNKRFMKTILKIKMKILLLKMVKTMVIFGLINLN